MKQCSLYKYKYKVVQEFLCQGLMCVCICVCGQACEGGSRQQAACSSMHWKAERRRFCISNSESCRKEEMEGYIWFFISDSKLGRQFRVDQERKTSFLENQVTLRMSKWSLHWLWGSENGMLMWDIRWVAGNLFWCSHFGASWCPREIVSGASKSDQSGVQWSSKIQKPYPWGFKWDPCYDTASEQIPDSTIW